MRGLVAGSPAPLAGGPRLSIAGHWAGVDNFRASMPAAEPGVAAHAAAACPAASSYHYSTPALPSPPSAELPSLAEQQLLKKHLKLSQEELAIGSLADAQLMRIAARDC